jgi:hypothetical protein
MTGPRSSSSDGKIKYTDVWCKVCKKPIGKRRSSMTSWIFQDSRCQCKEGTPTDGPAQAASALAEPATFAEPVARPLKKKLSPEMEWQIAEESIKQDRTSVGRLAIAGGLLFAAWLAGCLEYFIPPGKNAGLLAGGLAAAFVCVVFADKLWRLTNRVNAQQRGPNLIQVTKFCTYGLLTVGAVNALAFSMALVRSTTNSMLQPVANVLSFSWSVVWILALVVVAPLLLATVIVAFRHEDEL